MKSSVLRYRKLFKFLFLFFLLCNSFWPYVIFKMFRVDLMDKLLAIQPVVKYNAPCLCLPPPPPFPHCRLRWKPKGLYIMSRSVVDSLMLVDQTPFHSVVLLTAASLRLNQRERVHITGLAAIFTPYQKQEMVLGLLWVFMMC